MASLALGLAGAAIGNTFGYAALGYTIGSALGDYLFAPEGPTIEGPRLTDLSVQVSSYGRDIPSVDGTARMSGNVIWSTDLRETRHEREVGGGKGGGSTQISYTYSASFAVQICEGEIEGIRRIWANNKLIYDFSADSAASLYSSMQQAEGITFYLGTETQDPDPIIEAAEGAGNVPAFRGTAYVVFDDLQLEDYFNRIPQLAFEVVANGTTSSGLRELDNKTFTETFCTERANVAGVSDGVVYIEDTDGNIDGFSANGDYLGGFSQTLDNSFQYSVGSQGFGLNLYRLGCRTGDKYVKVYGGIGSTPKNSPSGGTYLYIDNADWVSGNWGTSLYPYLDASADVSGVAGTENGKYLLIVQGLGGFGSKSWTILDFSTGIPKIYDTGTVDASVTVAQIGAGFHSTAGASKQSNFFCADLKTLWWATGDGTCRIFQIDASNVLKQIESVSITPTGSFTSLMVDSSGKIGWFFVENKLSILTYADTYSASTATLSNIISKLCLKVGLSAGDIDVSALTQSVKGFTRSRKMTARAAIEPLKNIYHFDVVETANKLKFINRGAASVKALAATDLGATNV